MPTIPPSAQEPHQHRQGEAGRFSDPEQWRFDWQQPYTRAEWLDQLPTSGALTRLPDAALAEILDDVGAAIDAIGGGFTMQYTTVVVTAALRR